MNVIIAADFLTFSKQISFPPSSIIFYLINGCLSIVWEHMYSRELFMKKAGN